MKNDKSNIKVIHKILLNFIYKSLIVIILFMSSLIYIKTNKNNKAKIKSTIYTNSLSFAKIYDLYNKYFGDVIPFKNIYRDNTKLVSSEKMKYNKVKKENNGYIFEMNDNMITSLTDGIIIKINKNSTYKTIITIQTKNDILITYGNLNSVNLKLYDYIKKGEILGYSDNKALYLVIKENGKYISYDKYM